MASLRRSVLASYPHLPLSLGSTFVIVNTKQIIDDIVTAMIICTYTQMTDHNNNSYSLTLQPWLSVHTRKWQTITMVAIQLHYSSVRIMNKQQINVQVCQQDAYQQTITPVKQLKICATPLPNCVDPRCCSTTHQWSRICQKWYYKNAQKCNTFCL